MATIKPFALMRSPPHPGALVREDVLKALGMSVTRAAEALGVSRPNLSQLLNERIDLSPEMALRLEAAFGLEADMLLAMQSDPTSPAPVGPRQRPSPLVLLAAGDPATFATRWPEALRLHRIREVQPLGPIRSCDTR